MDDKPPLEPHLRTQAEKARRELRDHPTPEQLAAYRAGELSGEEAERIKDHLALCPECAQLLLDLVAFEEHEPAEEPAGLANGNVEAAWQRLRPKLEEDQPAAPPVAAPERFRQTEKPDPTYTAVNWQRRLRSAYALAAALFFGVVGLTVWGVSQKRLAEQRTAPRLGDMLYFEETRGPAERERILGSQSVNIVLPTSATYQDYEVEIVDAEGRPVWHERRQVGEDDSLFLGLTGTSLPPGLYEIRVYGIEGDRKILRGEHGIEIISSGSRRP